MKILQFFLTKAPKSQELLVLIGWLIVLLGYFVFTPFFPFGMPDGDIYLYRRLAGEVLSGNIPYIDFYFEYPPASIFVFLVPFALQSIFSSYIISFQVISWIILLFTTWILYLIYLKHSQKTSDVVVFGMMSALMWLLLPLAINRYDTFPLFFSVLGLWFYIQTDSINGWNWGKSLGWLLFILAGLIKLYPFFVLPVLFLHDLKTKQYKQLGINILVSGLYALPFGFWMIRGLDGLKFFLNYHSSRGLEIESTSASILLLLQRIFGIGDSIITYEFASIGLDGTWSDGIASILTTAFLVVYGIMLIIFYWRSTTKTDQILSWLFPIVMGITVVFASMSKVFSAQYVVWFVPLMVTWVMFSRNHRVRFRRQLYFVIFVIVSTLLIFPFLWGVYVDQGSIPLTIMLVIRNVSLLIFGVYMVLEGCMIPIRFAKNQS